MSIDVGIEVHIDHLVIEGLPVGPDQADLIRAAIEGELARLLASGGPPTGLTRGGTRPEARGGAISYGTDDTPATLGTRIGRAIHGGIGG